MKNIIFSTFLILYLLLITLGYLVGAKPLIVTSNSMAPSINKGDLVVVSKKNNYQVNEVVSFKSMGKVVTHRLAVKESAWFLTKGDANESLDFGVVFKKDILGKVVAVVPFLGFLLMGLQSKYFFYFILIFTVYSLFKKVKNVKK